MDVSQCEEQIVRVDENNVEVRQILFTRLGDEVILDSYTESYGYPRVFDERERLGTQRSEIQEPGFVQAEVLEIDTLLSRLNRIETFLSMPMGKQEV